MSLYTNHRLQLTLPTATIHHTLRTLRDFFAWLHGVEVFRRKIKPGDIA